jgi:hypothetical protein
LLHWQQRYIPRQAFSPSFEQLFGFVKKAVKKVADVGKKVAKAAAKVGAGFIFKKLRKLVKPLLRKVVTTAIEKLPAQYRPLASTVAQKLGFLKEIEEEVYEANEDAVQDLREIQREFNETLAQLVFADTEAGEDLVLSHYTAEARQVPSNMLIDLDRERTRFSQSMVGLNEREDPAPHVENFVSAILPALRLGIKIIGRPKVVSFLARLVAKLIRRFVGKAHAPALSHALVDVGLRLINLEATAEDERRVAGDAIAAVVEGTVRRVATLPEEVLEDEELLEAFVLDAFEGETAAVLPPVLSEEVYETRPDLREAETFKSAWVRQPLYGPKRYNKCTRIFDVLVVPHVAEAITTFGGYSLAGFLRDRLGLPAGRPVRARVHLYEAIPGTLPGLICWYEKRIPGFGTASRTAWSQLHPLTPLAAGLLLSAPALGRDIPVKYRAGPHPLFVGQRLYALEIPGARPQTIPGQKVVALREPGSVDVTLDFQRNESRVTVFLSEVEAQQIAAKIRQRSSIGIMWRAMRPRIRAGLEQAFSTQGRVSIIHPALAAGGIRTSPLGRLPRMLIDWLEKRLRAVLRRGLIGFLRSRGQEFVAATEQPLDGVTIVVTVDSPPGWPLLRKALQGGGIDFRGLQLTKDMPNVTVRVVGGHQRA